MGTGGDTVGPGGNQYPGGETVNACFGQCPKGECDDEGFWSDTPCAGIYPAPIDESSSYCGAGDGAYCLEVGGTFGETFGVRCVGGKATVRLCSFACGGSGLSDFECK
jgi:hypothetical protein